MLGDGLLAHADAVVGEVGDVDEAVDAADVDEGAEGHDLADGAVEDVALFELIAEGLGAFAAFLVEEVASGEDDVAAAALVELADLGGEFLADHDGEVGDAVEGDLGGGHEGLVAGDFDFQAALIDGDDLALDGLADFEIFPSGLDDDAGARADEDVLGLVELIDGDFELGAGGGELGLVGILGARDDAELFGAELDEDVGGADGDDGAGAIFAPGLDDARAFEGGLGGAADGGDVVAGEGDRWAGAFALVLFVIGAIAVGAVAFVGRAAGIVGGETTGTEAEGGHGVVDFRAERGVEGRLGVGGGRGCGGGRGGDRWGMSSGGGGTVVGGYGLRGG